MKSILPVLGSKPIDRLALSVILDGEHWEPSIPTHLTNLVKDLPPKCQTPPKEQQMFLGQRRGSLVAIGFLSYNRNQKPVWLMRCDCGRYTFRYILGWSRRVGVFDQCVACDIQKSLTHIRPSLKTHGIRKAHWTDSLVKNGFSDAQIVIITKYALPTDDLDWLHGALASLPSLQASH